MHISSVIKISFCHISFSGHQNKLCACLDSIYGSRVILVMCKNCSDIRWHRLNSNQSKTNCPKNLNSDGLIVREMGRWPECIFRSLLQFLVRSYCVYKMMHRCQIFLVNFEVTCLVVDEYLLLWAMSSNGANLDWADHPCLPLTGAVLPHVVGIIGVIRKPPGTNLSFICIMHTQDVCHARIRLNFVFVGLQNSSSDIWSHLAWKMQRVIARNWLVTDSY